MSNRRENPVQFNITINPDGSVTIQTEHGELGHHWDAGTDVAIEIVDMLEDGGML